MRPIIGRMASVRSHREVILALGGPSKLARQLGLPNPVNTTIHWSRRGIPSRYWHRIAELAGPEVVTAHELATLPPVMEAA